MGLEDSGYSGMVFERLSSLHIDIGDLISIERNGNEFTGLLMPRSQIGSDENHIVIKLENGYNIGVCIDERCIIGKKKSSTKRRRKPPVVRDVNPNLPTVSIISTGGTIASRVDYRTGAVNPALTAQDLYDSVPELEDYANVHAKVLMSVLSENITPSDCTKLVKKVASEIRRGVDGVIIAHGTDTMGYTAAALSFALSNLPVPVALVGSQRSSDRPSSDSALNLIGATKIVGKADIAEVMVVMHGETDDSFLYAHRGTRVRKFHSSRRDAFQSVNDYPLLRINDRGIEEISEPLLRRNAERIVKVKPKFEEKVALVKTYPGMRSTVVETLLDDEYKGLVIEGTGLGHAPDILRPVLKKAIESEVIVVMTTQCINGRVDMNVYRTGVQLLDLGVIPCDDMLAETALVKLMWLLANTKDNREVRTLMVTPLAGEIGMRSEYSQYHISSRKR